MESLERDCSECGNRWKVNWLNNGKDYLCDLSTTCRFIPISDKKIAEERAHGERDKKLVTWRELHDTVSREVSWLNNRCTEIRQTQWKLAECIEKGHSFVERHDAKGWKTCARCGFNGGEI